MLRDLVVKNRSYRQFVESPRVTREKMAEYVELARFAPSSVNIQPLKYRLVSDPVECTALFPLTGWARALPEFPGPAEGHRPTGYVLICHDTEIAPNAARFDRDIGIVAQTIMLRAVEDGFGGCMIGNFNPEKVAALLGVDERYKPCLLLALGVPGEEIILEDAKPGQSVSYYRDEQYIHHVPKRTLDEVLL